MVILEYSRFLSAAGNANLLRATGLIVLLAWLLTAPAGISAEKDIARRLKKEAATRPADFSAPIQTYEGILEHLRTVRIPLSVNAPGCYRVAVAAEETVEDLSLVLYQSGKEAARDRLSGKRPSVDWCAAEGGNVEAEVMMYGGRGAFALALFRKEKSRSLWGGRLKAGGGDKDFIANRIRQLQPRFAKGKAPLTAVLRGSEDEGDARSFPVKLRGGCITVLAAQSPSLLKLDISLSGPQGPVTTSLRATAGFTTLDTAPCPKAGVYTLTVRAVQGSGDFGIQVFSE